MKRLLLPFIVFVLVLMLQGCVAYPYGHSTGYSGYTPSYGYQPYSSYGYPPYTSYGWGGNHQWGEYRRGYGGHGFDFGGVHPGISGGFPGGIHHGGRGFGGQPGGRHGRR